MPQAVGRLGPSHSPQSEKCSLVRLTGRMTPLKLHSVVPVKLFLKRDSFGAGVAGLENQVNLHYIFQTIYANLICIFYLFLTHSSSTFHFWLKYIHKPRSKNCWTS